MTATHAPGLACPVADRADAKADVAVSKAHAAYDHALALFDSLGALARDHHARHLETRAQLAEIRRTVGGMIGKIPEIVEEEITSHGREKELLHWRWVKRHGWKFGLGALVGLAYALGARGPEVLSFLLKLFL